jgi:branched-chain amino acid transport system substrate-binding protein
MYALPSIALNYYAASKRPIPFLAQILSCMLLLAIPLASCTTVSKVPVYQDGKLRGGEAQIGVVAPTPLPEIIPSSMDIALLLPLTGASAEIGMALRNAALLAQENAPALKLHVYDVGESTEETEAVTQKALADGNKIIIGPVFAHSTLTVAALAREKSIPVIAFTNNASVAGNGVFILGYQPTAQVDRVIRYALSRGIREFCVLAPANAYGKMVQHMTQQAINEQSASVLVSEFYTDDAESIQLSVQSIADVLRRAPANHSANPRALLIAEGGKNLAIILTLLEKYAITPGPTLQLLGTGQWDDPASITTPALYGAWFASASPSRHQAFVTHFNERYHESPPWIASLAYDAMGLAHSIAVQQTSQKDLTVAEALIRPGGFAGIQGIFRFDGQNIAEHGLAVITISEHGFNEIEPAPTHFTH